MRSVTIKLKKNKYNKFYKKIKWLKIITKFKHNIQIEYIGKVYTERSLEYPIELKEILKIAKILNASSKREKITLAYDYACDYLDEQFINKNLCGFKNDMCICNSQKLKEKQVNSCCVSTTTKELCNLFDKKNKCCKTKNLACKLFVCPALYKKKIRFPIRKIPYIKYFFNFRQKLVAKTYFFLEKEKVIENLMTFYKF